MRRVSTELDMQAQLRSLAREVVAGIAESDPAHSRELLSAFVSELVLAVADQSQREERRQKQAEGMTMFEALKYQSCMEALMREIEREKEKLVQLRRIEEEKRARVVESRVETKTLEKLKEIKLQDYNYDIHKEEERFIDDLTATKRVLSNA